MLYKPSYETDYDAIVYSAAAEAHCTPEVTEEIRQYVRVLEAKNVAPTYILMALGRYAKIRGKYYE